MNDSNWIAQDPTLDPMYFDGVRVTIDTRPAGKVEGRLKVEESRDGQIKLAVSYNNDPFPGKTDIRTFYLTQKQLDILQEEGRRCVLTPPPQSQATKGN